jgi:hypothetical protein
VRTRALLRRQLGLRGGSQRILGVLLAGQVDGLAFLDLFLVAALQHSLDVLAEINYQGLVGGALEERIVGDSFYVLFIILVVSPANAAIFVLASGLGHQLHSLYCTMSSISMRDSATLFLWSASSCC